MQNSLAARVILILMNLTTFVLSQRLVPEDSRIDWSNAGLINAILYADNRLKITDYSGNDDDKVIQALNDAVTQSGVQIIYFPAGTYTFTKPINLNRTHSNIVFQGDGSDKTFFVFTNSKCEHAINIVGDNPTHERQVNSDVLKTNRDISISETSDYNVGNWIQLIEKSNPLAFWSREGSSGQSQPGQITQILNIGTNITMSQEASIDYSSNYQLFVQKMLPVENIGIENLKIYRIKDGDGKGKGVTINIVKAVNCWVRGVESYNAFGRHINIYESAHIEISGCYIHHAFDYYFGATCSGGEDGFGYGLVLSGRSTNCLIENNIFMKNRHAMLTANGANTNVFVYNYSRDTYVKDAFTPPLADIVLHGQYSYANLFEHNYSEIILADDTHGNNGPYNAFFRNRVDADGRHEASRIQIWDAKNTSVIACDIDFSPTYQSVGGLFKSGSTTWSNHVYGRNKNSSSSSNYWTHEMVALFPWDTRHEIFYLNAEDESFFYNSKPSFLVDYTFPSIGPFITKNGNSLSLSIPAKGRYSLSVKTYNSRETKIHEPLSVNISGPTWLDNYEYGTFTANPGGGSGSYVDYKWWSRNDEGIIKPLSLTGGVEPNAPNVGVWYPVSSWDGLSTVTPGYNWDFSLKCEVTDSEGQTATDIHSVIVGSPLLAASQQNGEMSISAVPAEFSLQGNYPNPFNPVTTIRFGLPEAANVKLVIYSVTGAKVATLVDGYLSEGYHEARWNGLNQAGARVASGIYIYELTSGEKRFIKKMLLLK